jgi:hypothetical protein
MRKARTFGPFLLWPSLTCPVGCVRIRALVQGSLVPERLWRNRFFAPLGLDFVLLSTHDLRCGLYSVAALRLI